MPSPKAGRWGRRTFGEKITLSVPIYLTAGIAVENIVTWLFSFFDTWFINTNLFHGICSSSLTRDELSLNKFWYWKISFFFRLYSSVSSFHESSYSTFIISKKKKSLMYRMSPHLTPVWFVMGPSITQTKHSGCPGHPFRLSSQAGHPSRLPGSFNRVVLLGRPPRPSTQIIFLNRPSRSSIQAKAASNMT